MNPIDVNTSAAPEESSENPKTFYKVNLVVQVPYVQEVIIEADDEDDAIGLALENIDYSAFVAPISIEMLDTEVDEVFEIDSEGNALPEENNEETNN